MNKPKTTTNEEKLKMVTEYIHRHYDEELHLSTLSALVNMAPTTLCRFFKRQAGIHLSDYITEVRLDAVEQKLLYTDIMVRDISFQCGFNTLSIFNRLFKRRFGCSPTAYRKNNNH